MLYVRHHRVSRYIGTIKLKAPAGRVNSDVEDKRATKLIFLHLNLELSL